MTTTTTTTTTYWCLRGPTRRLLYLPAPSSTQYLPIPADTYRCLLLLDLACSFLPTTSYCHLLVATYSYRSLSITGHHLPSSYRLGVELSGLGSSGCVCSGLRLAQVSEIARVHLSLDVARRIFR